MASDPLEKVQSSIEKMARYLVSEVATKKDLENKADNAKVDIVQKGMDALYSTIDSLNSRVCGVENKLDILINGLDAQAQAQSATCSC